MGRQHNIINHASSRTGRTQRSRHSVIVLVAAGALALSACGGSDDAQSASTNSSADMAMEGGVDNAEVAQTGGDTVSDVSIDAGRAIIRNIGLTMSTSAVDATVDDIRRIVSERGGSVFGSDVSIGDARDDGSVPGGGQIVVRIAPEDLDDLLTALDGAGLVTRLSQDAQDVTNQLVDLDIRIRQAETSVERVELLLSEATELEDVFAIENELNDRIVKLEQLRAQERATDDLVSLATLTINVEYRTPNAIEELQADDGIGDAFSDGWSAFLGAVFALGYVLAISAPFLVVGAFVLLAAWLLGRRMTRRSAARREQQRLDADRRGEPAPVAQYPVQNSQATPPPPRPSDRIGAETNTSTSPGDTRVADHSTDELTDE